MKSTPQEVKKEAWDRLNAAFKEAGKPPPNDTETAWLNVGIQVAIDAVGALETELRDLGEDVTTHAMGPWYTHSDDGRNCGYHNRLGVWATIDKDTRRWTLQCLRDHD